MTAPNDVAALVEHGGVYFGHPVAQHDHAVIRELRSALEASEAKVATQAATIAALQAEVERAKEARAILPPLDDDMIRAALGAHYGKKPLRELGINGVDLTVNDVNWTFKQGFSRMWNGVRKELAARSASRKENTP